MDKLQDGEGTSPAQNSVRWGKLDEENEAENLELRPNTPCQEASDVVVS